MKIGIVNPYSWDVPGGVGFHIRDLALKLRSRGHDVQVLTPSTSDDLPDWITSAGSSVSIPFNGSVANISVKPKALARTRRWLADNDFDVVHVHEPVVPSVSMAAAMLSSAPLVGTFHAALGRSVSRAIASAPMRLYMERIGVRIAVSEEARRTLIEHHGGDAVIIPNGVETASFRSAQPLEQWAATEERPVIVFLGRLDEPRKGLSIFAGAIAAVLERFPVPVSSLPVEEMHRRSARPRNVSVIRSPSWVASVTRRRNRFSRAPASTSHRRRAASLSASSSSRPWQLTRRLSPRIFLHSAPFSRRDVPERSSRPVVASLSLARSSTCWLTATASRNWLPLGPARPRNTTGRSWLIRSSRSTSWRLRWEAPPTRERAGRAT